MIKQIVIIFGVLLAGLNFANAHQQKESYSEILVNERSGNLEISHRFYIHDAGHAIGRILAKMQNTNKPKLSRDWQNDPVSQQYFADYLSQHFFLRQVVTSDTIQEPLALNLVGFEVEGKYFWIYQEMVVDMFLIVVQFIIQVVTNRIKKLLVVTKLLLIFYW